MKKKTNNWELEMIKPVLTHVVNISKHINPKAKKAIGPDDYLFRGPKVEAEVWKLLRRARELP